MDNQKIKTDNENVENDEESLNNSNNSESENINSEKSEIEFDNAKIEHTELEEVESNNVEMDNIDNNDIETDISESDNMRNNNKTDNAIETDNMEINDKVDNTIETDIIGTTNDVEIDNIETDNIKADNTEADITETDDADTDNIETDNMEIDNLRTDDSESENSEMDKTEEENPDYTEIDNVKENNSVNDTDDDNKSDNIETDNTSINNIDTNSVESSSNSQSRKNNFNKRINKEIDNVVNCPELCLFDDILCDILIDNLFLGFRTHKVNNYDESSFSKPPSPQEANCFSEAVLEIITRNLLVDNYSKHGIDKCYNELFTLLTSDTLYMDYDLSSLISTKLIKFPTFKEFFNSLSEGELNYFEEHAKRYIEMYHIKAGYQLMETKRYKSTGKKECCLIATKEWRKGDVLNYCNGILCPMTTSDTAYLKNEDFSIMFASSLQCNALFLGPGRFMNHDCQPNCEFISNNGRVNFRVIRNIKIGEELTVYYSESYFGTNNCDCLCASCEEKQLGGFSRYTEESTTSESEKESNSSQIASSVLRHRRRAQPLSFKYKYGHIISKSDSNSDINHYICCCVCHSKIKKKTKSNSKSKDNSKDDSIKCDGCLRHEKIFGQNWPTRDFKNRKDQFNNDDKDNLNDFKEYFYESIKRGQINENYDCLYDYYNRHKNKDKNSSNLTTIDIIKNGICETESHDDIFMKKENQEEINKDAEVDDDVIIKNDSLKEIIQGTDYSDHKINKKRKFVLGCHLKAVNRVAKRRKFTLYNNIPSTLSYETLFYYGFSDFALGLDTEKKYYLFGILSEIVERYEDNIISFDCNLINRPLPLRNSPKVNSIVYDRHIIYLDPLLTPEIIYNTMFNENYKERQQNVVTNIDLEFIKNRYNRVKLKNYLSYNTSKKQTVIKDSEKLKKNFKYYGIHSLLERLQELYDLQWSNIRRNNISDLNSGLLDNHKYYNNLHSVKLYNIEEIVDCYSESGWYKAKIKRISFDKNNNHKYYIHYDGWGSGYDEWKTGMELRTPHEEISQNQSSTIGL